METIDQALNDAIDMHAGPTEEKIKSTLDSLNRLISELELPQNHELVRFLVAWRGLEQELARLESEIRNRVTQKPSTKIDEFLKKLRRKS